MRVITLVIIHCSAVTPDQTSSAAQIDSWHRKDRHYKFGIGYHYVIRRNGDIELGRPEWMVGAHCLNHNKYSIGVVVDRILIDYSDAAAKSALILWIADIILSFVFSPAKAAPILYWRILLSLMPANLANLLILIHSK